MKYIISMLLIMVMSFSLSGQTMEKFFNEDDTVLISYSEISRAYETVDTTIELIVGFHRHVYNNQFDTIVNNSVGQLIEFEEYYKKQRVALNPHYIREIRPTGIDSMLSLISIDPEERFLIRETLADAEARIDSLTSQ